MSEQQRRRLRPRTTRQVVGQPNVLSNQATPNRLSTMRPASGPAGGLLGTVKPSSSASAAPARPASDRSASVAPTVARPRPPMGVPTEAPGGDAPARGRRLPSFGTLLFIAFAIYWAVRAFSNAGFGGPDPTTAPAPGGGGAVGVVTFGQGLDDECSLTQSADRFPTATDVWWRADLASEQAADADVVVRSYHDEGQIDRREVPAEPELGVWDVLCAGEPVPGDQPGAYRVEVWDATESVLLAVGSYSKGE